MRIANLLRQLGFPVAASPSAATVTVSDNGDGSGGVATIAGSTPGSTNAVYYAAFAGLPGSSPWVLAGSRIGDGTLALTQQGAFLWLVVSTFAGLTTAGANVYYQALTNPAALSSPYEFRLADAIAVELNDPARAWHNLFAAETTTAARTLSPWYQGPELKTLKVAVVPLVIERDRIARVAAASGRKFDYSVAIDFQRRIESTDDPNLKLFSACAEKIHDWFDNGHELATMPGWFCLKSDRRDVYDLNRFYADRVWETLVSVDMRGHRL